LERPDDFEKRRQHLKGLSDEELKQRFWQLAEEIVRPLYELAWYHTSPSIERSVLLRMGFSSLEAKSIVSGLEKRGLLGKGAGRAVLEYAAITGAHYLDAGRALSEGKGWEELSRRLGGASN
jgi:D-ornithine 4,5-aminomutase subunit alpha